MRSGLLWGAVGLLGLLLPSEANAYPFMIRHGYTGCAQCHVDPSGGGPLTEYGRGQAEIFMRTVYKDRGADWQGPGPEKDFLFGAVPLPDWLFLQGDIRSMVIPEPGNVRFLLMQSDLRAAVQASNVTAYISGGVVSEGAEEAWVTSNTNGANFVSREYWAGYSPAKGLLIRGGRMDIPFGIRSEEHILFARSSTDTTTNDNQQVGLDAVYGKGKLRAEVMGIAGNFQLSPDDFRERGYSALAAWAITNRFELGVTSLVAHAALDVDSREERLRQAHGLFGRWAPVQSVGFLAEADALLDASAGASSAFGTTGYLQVDYEPVQGLHLKGTGEWCDNDLSDTDSASLRGSATALWFLAPHVDVRADVMYGTLYCTPGTAPTPMGLVQLHMFL